MLRPYAPHSRLQELVELLRQLRPDPRLLVLEENERVLPPLAQLLHRLGPLLEILLLVALVAQPHVAEVGGRDERGMPLLRVRHAQRGVGGAQRRVHVVREPGLVAELPGAAQVGGELREQVVQPVQILLEVGGELKQHRPELGPELARRLDEVAERVVHVLEPRDMGDALRRLEHERESGGRRLVPSRHGLRVRHPIERVVHLDGGEVLRVVLEHLGLGGLGRIERPLPLGKIVARRADADVYATHTVLMFTNSRSPYSDSSRPYPERFTPPNGSRGSDLTNPFTNTLPASSSRATRSPRARSAVQTEAPSPYTDAFAIRTASASPGAPPPRPPGPEGFFIDRGSAGLYRGEERGWIERARAVRQPPAEHQPRAPAHRLLDLAMQVGAQVEPRLRAHGGRRIARVAHAPRTHLGRQLRRESVRDPSGPDGPFRRHAALAALPEPGLRPDPHPPGP